MPSAYVHKPYKITTNSQVTRNMMSISS